MITIRDYREADAEQAGLLIADTFREFNLSDLPLEQQELMLGPFRHARSSDPEHRDKIAEVIQADIVFVAADGETIAGVLRGRVDRLQSLFVRKDYHRQGIGRRLVSHFETACLAQGTIAIKLQATLYAVPFYLNAGYKKSTGVRSAKIFDGEGFRYQPMKKVLAKARFSDAIPPHRLDRG